MNVNAFLQPIKVTAVDILDGDGDEKYYRTGIDVEDQKILDFVDEAEKIPEIDQQTFRKIIAKFEKAVAKNADLRSKYSSTPMKYIDSEADLEEMIKTATQLSATPKYYNILIESTAHISILTLVEHENTDIALSAITLISELLDEDIDINLELLLDSLVENDLFNILVRNFGRLDETRADDKQGIFNILGLLESVLSLKPELDVKVFNAIQQWLLKRLSSPDFDSLKQYCTELLSILLQTNQVVRQDFISLDGIDLLLASIARYRKSDPTDSDETEYMENLVDCLCLCLETRESKDIFLDKQGIQLTLMMIKAKKMCSMRALKLLCHAIDNPSSTSLLIEKSGLKTIFSSLISDSKKIQQKYKDYSSKDHDASLLKNAEGIQEHRIIYKFIENEHEKLKRILILRVKYNHLFTEQDYLDRLEIGLHTLQMIDLIIVYLMYKSSSEMDVPLGMVLEVVQEYSEYLETEQFVALSSILNKLRI